MEAALFAEVFRLETTEFYRILAHAQDVCVMRCLLVTILLCVGCASSGPSPGTLDFIRLEQHRELVLACQRTMLARNPRMKTYYNLGGVFVDEQGYCEIKAHQATRTISFR